MPSVATATLVYAIPRINRATGTRKPLTGTRRTPATGTPIPRINRATGTRREMPRMTGCAGEAGKLVVRMFPPALDAVAGVHAFIDPIVGIGGTRRAVATRPPIDKSNIRP
jgi:hypothetical protein